MMHIEGRRWFDKRYGNTYHSVRIFIDGELALSEPYAYGYDDQYLETALELLEEAGHIERTEYPNGGYRESGTRYIREELGASWSVIDVARKRDL